MEKQKKIKTKFSKVEDNISNKKKICVYGLTSKIGGIENFYIEYYRKLDKSRYQIDFITKESSMVYEKEILNNNGTIYKIPSLKKSIIKHYYMLNKIFRDNKYDILHCNLGYLKNISYLKLAKKNNVKEIIVHAHGSGIKAKFLNKVFHNKNKRVLAKYATTFLACSKKAANWMFKKNIDYKILNNTINVEKFKYNEDFRNQIRKKLDLENCFVIGHVGRFCEDKNHLFLVKCFNEYSKINDKAKLILIGRGKGEKKVRKFINKNKLNSKIKIVYTEDVYKYYSAFDLFVLPSKSEGFPIVGIEAQANGLPCLFSDVITQEIKINQNVKFLSINDLNTWINNLSEINKRIKKLNSKINNYDIDKQYVNLEKIYRGE